MRTVDRSCQRADAWNRSRKNVTPDFARQVRIDAPPAMIGHGQRQAARNGTRRQPGGKQAGIGQMRLSLFFQSSCSYIRPCPAYARVKSSACPSGTCKPIFRQVNATDVR